MGPLRDLSPPAAILVISFFLLATGSLGPTSPPSGVAGNVPGPRGAAVADPCALLPEMFPVLLNGTANQSFISLMPLAPFTNYTSNGTLPIPLPPNVTYARPPVATVGEARADWHQICTTPLFVDLAENLSVGEFSSGGGGNTSSGLVYLTAGFDWAAGCPPTNASWLNGTAQYAPYSGPINWSHLIFTGSGCSYQTEWSASFNPDGTTSVSGPFGGVGLSIYHGPGGTTGPPGGSGGIAAVTLLIIAFAVLVAVSVGVFVRRRPPNGGRGSPPAGVPGPPPPPAQVGESTASRVGAPDRSDPLADLL